MTEPDLKTVVAQAMLHGDPGIILPLLRKQLLSAKMVTAAVSKHRTDWWGNDHSIGLNWINASEKKLADMALSRLSPSLSGSEIAAADALHTILFNVLRGRSEIPDFQVRSGLSVDIIVEGKVPELAKQILALGPSEAVAWVRLAAAYRYGNPRRAELRWLQQISAGSTAEVLRELTLFEGALDPIALAEIKDGIETAALFFRRRRRSRESVIASLASTRMGNDAQAWLQEHRTRWTEQTRLQEMTEDHEYQRAIRQLKAPPAEPRRSPNRRVPG